MKPISGIVAIALACLAQPPAAQNVFGNYSIAGNLCVGANCTGSENFGFNDTLKLKYQTNAILFDDTSTPGLGYPAGDWRLKANDTFAGGASYFALEDADGAGAVLSVADGTRANALFIDAAGQTGLGTALPAATLHLVAGSSPAIRVEQDGSGGGTPQAWQLTGDDAGLRLSDLTAASVPLAVLPGAPDNALVLDTGGRLGLGTDTPAAGLDLRRDDGAARLQISETAATTLPRTLVTLANNGRPEIVMANTHTNGEWSFGAGTRFILKQGAVGTPSSAKTKLFEIDESGNATLAGTLVTGGTTCGGGCDAVFTDRAILAQPAYAARMWAQGFLPNVGPTPEGAPIDLTQKLGGMLNALEHAHIFIDRQEVEIARLRAEKDALERRVDALERLISRAP